MIHLKIRSLLFYITLLLFIGCTGNTFIKPAPDAYKASPDPPDQLDDESSDNDTSQIDFSAAIPDPEDIESSDFNRFDSAGSTPDTLVEKKSAFPAKSIRYSSFKVRAKSIRVVLSESARPFNIYSAGAVAVHSPGKVATPLYGSIRIQKKNSQIVTIESRGTKKDIFLPCTIMSVNKYNFIDYDEKSYRGVFAFYNGSDNALLLVNILDIEEYLRGVVPLELGKRGEEDLEALKAQAVAARTYAYKRIEERKTFLFDLYSTVKDQVYGGANSEYRVADIAVKMTKDIILTFGDSIVYAYYHSTCGGRTASIQDAWPRKSPQPYLTSVSDCDSAGKSYCVLSKYHIWREVWPGNQFRSILLKNIGNNAEYDKSNITGGDFKFRIVDKYGCGRVKTLQVEGSGWKRNVVADKTRYVLRRGSPDHPILRSANFNIDSFTKNEVAISGKGYGHGVGMCQMGAIGRARAGYTFEEILKSYYTGVQLSICSME